MPAVECDSGLGTTYERIAVALMLESLAREHRPARVLEGPCDGITGIRGLNSIPLAAAGASVEVVLGDADEIAVAARVWESLGLGERVRFRLSTDYGLRAAPSSFDLVWSFNALPQAPDPPALIHEMCGASARLVLVFTSNTWNYGYPVHRLHHRAAREPWDHGDPALMSPRRIHRLLRSQGFQIVETLLVDVPWWPDIDSPIEEVLATFLPFLRGRARSSKRLERYTWAPDDLPYFEPARRRALVAEIGRHFLIERARALPLKLFFAHHRGILARRREP